MSCSPSVCSFAFGECVSCFLHGFAEEKIHEYTTLFFSPKLISETASFNLDMKLFLTSLCTCRKAGWGGGWGMGVSSGSARKRAFRRPCPLTHMWGSEESEKVTGVLVFTKAGFRFFFFFFLFSFLSYVAYVTR